jgi:1-acyl-sn-glycerol-3-phosphate acyltransferase
MRYVFTTYIAVLLIAALPPLWILLLILPPGRWPRAMLRRWARTLIAVSGCGFRVTGSEHLRASLPVVMVANHTSYLDSVALMAALPIEYCFVANHGLTRVSLVGAAIRKAGYLTVNRSRLKARARCVTEMVQTIRGGTSILVYPEATTSRTRELLPFRPGAFRAAADAQCPVVPITIRGTAGIWPRGSWLMRPGTIDIRIHRGIETMSGGRSEVARLRDRARTAILDVGLCLDDPEKPFPVREGVVVPDAGQNPGTEGPREWRQDTER